MGARSRSRKAYGVIALVAILALSFSATAAFGAVKFEDADFSGYATGTVLHADALQSGPSPDGLRLADVEEAFTGSAVDSEGLTTIKNEMDRVVSTAAATKRSSGRGSGLEVGLAHAPDAENDIILADAAHAVAPPSTGVITNDLLDIPGSPLVYASVLRGQAQALWANNQCILGRDIAFGKGHAADAQLLNLPPSETNPDDSFKTPLLAASADEPERQVASSYSHNFMDVQKNAAGKPIGTNWGLSSEARMTIAPISLFKGTPNEITIEVAGEWVLRAAAGGIPGSAHIFYGPGDVNLQTPILRVLQDNEVLGQLLFQDIFGPEGLTQIKIPGLLEVAIGEDPRAIDPSGENADAAPPVAANGTSASAAVDVVRVKILDDSLGMHLADLRVGHMEVKTQVPAGGIDCGIPVTKSANPPGVTINQAFVVSIKIDNPFGCDLTAVKVVDDITTKGDAKFQVLSTNPQANTVPEGVNTEGSIVWNNIGAIPKGGSKTVTTTIRALGGGGEIDDVADVSAVLGNCEGSGEGNAIVGKSLPLRVPVVLKLKLPPTGVGTSSATVLAALMLLSLAGVTIRQIRRHA